MRHFYGFSVILRKLGAKSRFEQWFVVSIFASLTFNNKIC